MDDQNLLASSPLFFDQERSEEPKSFIFKRFLSLDNANQLLKSEGRSWLLRETNIPGVVALHKYNAEQNAFSIRRYAHIESKWIVIGNDLDALERHLINKNPSSIHNHEQEFFKLLQEDGFDTNAEDFLAPSSSNATNSPSLKAVSRGPSPFGWGM